MPQIQMLEPVQNFGSRIGQQLGSGVSEGIGESLGAFLKQKQQQQQTEQLLKTLGIQQPSAQTKTGAALGSLSAEAPSQTAGTKGLQLTPEKVLAAAIVGDKMGLPHFGTTMAGIYEGQQKEQMQSRKETFAREQAAEPKLLEIGDRLKSYEQSAMRFGRLNELFSPELEDKFPPTLAVGMLTKDGELTPIAQSQLSEEAQEAVKLVTDEIKGAKDTFGSRVTNFDATTYLKTLPNLLNSAAGKRRVLRDLRIMNELNQMHDQGILDIIDRQGGAGKIPISKAEQIFRHENKAKIKELQEEFVNPKKAKFKEPPDASRYPNRRVVDGETGQILRSNGKEWLPEER